MFRARIGLAAAVVVAALTAAVTFSVNSTLAGVTTKWVEMKCIGGNEVSMNTGR